MFHDKIICIIVLLIIDLYIHFEIIFPAVDVAKFGNRFNKGDDFKG